MVATGLAIGPVDLDHLDAPAPEEPGEADPIGAGAIDADLAHLAEALEPGHQLLVAAGVGGGRLGADEPTQRIESCSNVVVEMGVDTTGDAQRSFYDGHGRPYSP